MEMKEERNKKNFMYSCVQSYFLMKHFLNLGMEYGGPNLFSIQSNGNDAND